MAWQAPSAGEALFEGAPLRITTQLVDFDAKRMHFIQCMYHAGQGFLAARADYSTPVGPSFWDMPTGGE